jgi:hypothetical protein
MTDGASSGPGHSSGALGTISVAVINPYDLVVRGVETMLAPY